MRLFRDKELETRLDRIEAMMEEQDKRISKLLKKLNKPKEPMDEDRDRVERMDKSFQKLMNYNEDIAVKGYKK